MFGLSDQFINEDTKKNTINPVAFDGFLKAITLSPKELKASIHKYKRRTDFA